MDRPLAKEILTKIGAFIEIVRPVNVLITVFVALVGLKIARGFDWDVVWALATLCAFGNALNDLVDAKLDAIAHSKRPIPSGRLSGHEVKILVFALLGLIMLFSAGMKPMGALTLWGTVAVVAAYDLKLSKVPLIGNISVAFATAMAFIVAGAAIGNLNFQLFEAALLAFTFHMAREMVKDIEDMNADKLFGRKSLPIIAGVRFTVMSARLFGILFAVVSLIMALRCRCPGFWVFAAISNYIVLKTLFGLRATVDRKKFSKASFRLKIAIIPILMALAFV